ncbi:phosphotransferase [Burkholderia pseudomultivorans]|uniref:phosphotransferase enzyme family protein n=1 Tax=Burkholderia pseudomultivorans TaxID=1207504 RepID=UPI002876478C|nr:phosphotransferase [Burkholderia pseudomultivorans]MDS0792742.1 phosphotransferase [Burkholderia pseudomultivorans]
MSREQNHKSRHIEFVHRFVADEYDIDVDHIDEVVHGVNWTFRIAATTGANYFLRIYRELDRTPADIMAEIEVLNSIQTSEILKVSLPIKNRNQQYLRDFITADGIRRSAVLFAEARGRVPTPTHNDMHAAGLALAELHRQSWLTQLAPSRTLANVEWGRRVLDEVSAHSAAAANVVSRLVESFPGLFRVPAKEYDYWGFCHGDFRLDNLRLHDCTITLFDFDDCGTGPQLFDLATIAWWLELGPEPAPGPLWADLVDAYSHVLPDRYIENHEIARLVICNELRSLQFLVRYCRLPDELWVEQFDRLEKLCIRASDLELRILGADRSIASFHDRNS